MMGQAVNRKERGIRSDPRYSGAIEDLKHYAEQAGIFLLQKPGVIYDANIDIISMGMESGVFTSFNFQNYNPNFHLKFWVYPLREDGRTHLIDYERKIVCPRDDLKDRLESEEFFIASQALSLAYPFAKSMGLNSTIIYDRWPIQCQHRVKIGVNGFFSRENAPATLNLIKTVDELIDSRIGTQR